ncbi:MAG: hypothetical protein HYR60_02100, partial [Acidobacteria bacterium]|nr:hypothetical protein [Acidobacteriota bacterium]
FHLGGLLLNQRQYPEAIAHLEQTVSPEDENTPGYWYALGVAYGRSGDRVRAAEWMGKARQGALTRGQTQLASSIEKDLALLARAGTGR